jgi:hypothetical protein
MRDEREDRDRRRRDDAVAAQPRPATERHGLAAIRSGLDGSARSALARTCPDQRERTERRRDVGDEDGEAAGPNGLARLGAAWTAQLTS